MMNKLEILESKLRQVGDVYEDFVDGTMFLAKKDSALLDALLRYIDEHPNASTSEIIEFSTADLKIPD